MKTIIMAGGRGTRISSLFPNIPKPLIPIQGVPILEREIISLKNQNFTDIIITVSHFAEKLITYFGDGSDLGVHISYFLEEIPLGNAGALFKLREQLGNEPFLLLNADSLYDVDFNKMLTFHKKHNALVTLFTHPNSHPYDSGLIISDDDNTAKEWLTKEDLRPAHYKNQVNAGIHILTPAILDQMDINVEKIGIKGADGKTLTIDLDRQILKPLCGTHKMYCYHSPEYVKDMGTPERFYAVEKDFSAGTVQAKNLSRRQKAIFLDRDGTINKHVGFLKDINDLELIAGSADAIKEINKSSYLAIIVTNQPVIARGEVTVKELEHIHNKLETLLGLKGAYVDAIYYCPHHPDRGFEGEVSSLKINCECRKPKPGMLLKAAEKYNIDLSMSWIIGDGINDIQAGIAAGCKTVLLSTDSSLDFGQNYLCHSLLDAINYIFALEKINT